MIRGLVLLTLDHSLSALVFSFFLHNGYYFTMDRILKIEVKIDEGLDDIKKSAKAKQKKKKEE